MVFIHTVSDPAANFTEFYTCQMPNLVLGKPISITSIFTKSYNIFSSCLEKLLSSAIYSGYLKTDFKLFVDMPWEQ